MLKSLTADKPHPLIRFFARFGAAAREVATTPLYTVLIGLVIPYAAATWYFTHKDFDNDAAIFLTYNGLAYFAGGLLLAIFVPLRIFYIMLVRRPRRLTAEIIRDFRQLFLQPARWLGTLLMSFILILFFPFYTVFKSHIVIWHPFALDPALTHFDEMVHGGKPAWLALMPVLGFPGVTLALGFVYTCWFMVKFFVLYWQAFQRSRLALRAQFFLTVLITWIINGSLLALAFSSAGPCYYGRICPTLPNPYGKLSKYLQDVHSVREVGTINGQDYLWSHYTNGQIDAFAGISAFPSMHVTIAFAILLVCWSYNWFYRVPALLFFFSILWGSVMLGWHYAADGYFAIVDTFLVWLACGWLVRKFELHRPRARAEEMEAPVA